MLNSNSDSKEAYEKWHEQFEVDAQIATPWHQLVRTHLEPSRDLAGKRILEIGCGRGGFACWLASGNDRPAEIVATDFAASALRKGEEFASRHTLTGITWEAGDIQKIARGDSTFDTVISCETVEHVPDPQLAIRELARVLKPGGRLFLTTPNYLGPLGLYRFYLRLTGRRFTEEGQPINNFTLLPLTRSWIVRSGLRLRKIDAVGHYLPFPRRPPIECPAFNNPRSIMRWFGLHSLLVAEKP